jgi:hypothetical protein
MVGRKALFVSVGLIGISAAVAACSGATTGSSGPSASQAASDAATALCTRINACAPLFLQIAYGDMPTCNTRLTANLTEALSASGTGWTPSAVDACAKAIPGASCDDALAHNLPAVCHPPAGQLAIGAACGDNGQCSSGYCNLSSNGKCGSCAAGLGAAGAPCFRDDDCQFGIVCQGMAITATPPTAGKCTALAKSGESCDSNKPCLKTLACSAATGGVCGPTVAAGATCSQTADFFGTCGDVSGNYCSATTNGTCTSLDAAAAGQPCGLLATGKYATCSGSGVCNTMGGKMMGTCVAPAADFGSCNAKDGPGCLSPATCINSVCVLSSPDTCK